MIHDSCSHTTTYRTVYCTPAFRPRCDQANTPFRCELWLCDCAISVGGFAVDVRSTTAPNGDGDGTGLSLRASSSLSGSAALSTADSKNGDFVAEV